LYILIAVALIAALSVLVSRGGQVNSGLITDQQAKIAAQEIIAYGNTVAGAVQKLRLRGVHETGISFENDYTSANYTNGNCGNDSCKIFASGGNIVYTPPSSLYLDSSFESGTHYGEWV